MTRSRDYRPDHIELHAARRRFARDWWALRESVRIETGRRAARSAKSLLPVLGLAIGVGVGAGWWWRRKKRD